MQREERRTHSICTTESRHTHTLGYCCTHNILAHTQITQSSASIHTHTRSHKQSACRWRGRSQTHTHTRSQRNEPNRDFTCYDDDGRQTTGADGMDGRTVLCCLGSAAAAGACASCAENSHALRGTWLLYTKHTHTHAHTDPLTHTHAMPTAPTNTHTHTSDAKAAKLQASRCQLFVTRIQSARAPCARRCATHQSPNNNTRDI